MALVEYCPQKMFWLKVCCQQRPSVSFSHIHYHSVNPERRRSGWQRHVAVCSVQSLLSPLLPLPPTPGAEHAFGVNGDEHIYCIMPVIQCIACHLSPGGLLRNLHLNPLIAHSLLQGRGPWPHCWPSRARPVWPPPLSLPNPTPLISN